MNDERKHRPRIRYQETNLRALGIPQDSSMAVHEVHLEGFATLEEAVDIYRDVFDLSDRASITITSTPYRTTIDAAGDGIRLVRTRGDHRTLSAAMVIHR